METIRETVNAMRRQADELEALLGNGAEHLDEFGKGRALPIFDPETDEPPVKPWVDGSRAQRDWCSIVLWGRLRALAVRQGRGATPEESREIAISAGYKDGRGWNAWSAGWEKDSDGNRIFTEAGMGHLKHYYAQVGRALPEDLA